MPSSVEGKNGVVVLISEQGIAMYDLTATVGRAGAITDHDTFFGMMGTTSARG